VHRWQANCVLPSGTFRRGPAAADPAAFSPAENRHALTTRRAPSDRDQWGLIDTVWDPFFGSGTAEVLESDVSHEMTRWIRMPDAVLGALAYLGDILFALAGSTRRWQFRPWLVVLFGIDVIPLGIVSVILVVLQGAVVGAWCTLCLFTAVISLILIALAYDEVWSSLLYLRAAWRRADGFREWWGLFWGRASEAGHLAACDVLESPRGRRRRQRHARRRGSRSG